MSHDLHCSCIKHVPCINSPSQVCVSWCLSRPLLFSPGPPCSLLTSCSSWSCCYLKPRLVARVETPASSTMAGCPPCPPPCRLHQLMVPSWSPVWLRPSRVSSWAGWACSRSPTLGLECQCPDTSWIFTASTSSSTIWWRTLHLASPASTSSRLTPYAVFTTMVSSLKNHDVPGCKKKHSSGKLFMHCCWFFISHRWSIKILFYDSSICFFWLTRVLSVYS